jgi:hypothetical protein
MVRRSGIDEIVYSVLLLEGFGFALELNRFAELFQSLLLDFCATRRNLFWEMRLGGAFALYRAHLVRLFPLHRFLSKKKKFDSQSQ